MFKIKFSEFDEGRNCQVLDEDPLLDDLEEIQAQGGNIFEYHGAELFPERWFQLVIVLTTGNTLIILYMIRNRSSNIRYKGANVPNREFFF